MNRAFQSSLQRRIAAAEAQIPANKPVVKYGWYAPLLNHDGEKHIRLVSERKINEHAYWCQFEQVPGKAA